MPIADDIEPGSERIRSLIDFVQCEGWQVGGAPGGQLEFTKPSSAPVYTHSRASDANERRENRGASRGVAHDVPPGFPDSSAAGNHRPEEVRHA